MGLSRRRSSAALITDGWGVLACGLARCETWSMRLRREPDHEGPVAVGAPLRVFLNYRREDASGHAGRLYDALSVTFGGENVFMDVDAIEPGLDFSEVVASKVGMTDVLIALIGRDWLVVSDATGRRRLERPDDFVRMELRAGLEREGTRVIPVLVQGAEMPSVDDLPEDLAKLAFRNAVELRDTSWASDVARLQRALERIAEQKVERERTEAEAAFAEQQAAEAEAQAAERATAAAQARRDAEAAAKREAAALAAREIAADARREQAEREQAERAEADRVAAERQERERAEQAHEQALARESAERVRRERRAPGGELSAPASVEPSPVRPPVVDRRPPRVNRRVALVALGALAVAGVGAAVAVAITSANSSPNAAPPAVGPTLTRQTTAATTTAGQKTPPATVATTTVATTTLTTQAAYSTLLRHIPNGRFKSCTSASTASFDRAAIAVASCTGKAGFIVSGGVYWLWPNRASLNSWYIRTRAADHVSSNSGRCDNPPFIGEGPIVGAPSGSRFFCTTYAYNGFYHAVYAEIYWTIPSQLMSAEASAYGSATQPPGPAARHALYSTWRCCLNPR
jgi:hypothetical protein